MIEYLESDQDGFLLIDKEDAIKRQKEEAFKSHSYIYKNDTAAFNDFMANYWGIETE